MTKLKRKSNEGVSSNTKKARDDDVVIGDKSDDEMDLEEDSESDPQAKSNSLKRKKAKPKSSKTSTSTKPKDKAVPVALAESSSDSSSDEESNDDSDSDGEEEEEDEDNMFEAGQIMKVYVENFMNHKCFEINFGRKLNFITGANGSGKSAIVAALQLCLGVTARKTGRANNLAKMIRQGHDGNAVIRVTLLNEGPDAYRKEVYGNRITIERTISRSGGGAYRIMDVKNNKISGERRELDSMLRTFNIYCDNPCNVLTQEESKRFINGKEEDKYLFFLKATGIDRTQEEIDSMNHQLSESKKRVENQRKRLSKKRDTVKKYEEEFQKFAALEEDEQKLKRFAAKSLWREVQEQQDNVDALERTLEKLKQTSQKNQDNLKKLQDKCSQEEDESDYDAEIEAEKAKQDLALAALSEATVAFSHAKDASDSCKTEIKRGERHVNDLTKKEDRLKREQNTAQAKLDKSALSNEKPLLDRIDNFRAAIDQEKMLISQLDNKKAEIDVKVEEANAKLRVEKQNLNTEQKHLSNLNRDLQNTKKTSDNTAAIHPDLPRVLLEMKKLKFKGKVVGPVGRHVKIKDEFKNRYFQIERGLDKILSTFVVTDIQDQRTMGQLLRKLKVDRINIIKTSASPRYKTDQIPDALRLIDAVVVDDDLVYNVTLDKANAARVVLVQNPDEHRRYLDASGSFKHGIQSVLDQKANRIEVRNGNKRTMADRSATKNKKLVSDVAEIISALQNDIQSSKEQAAEIQVKYDQASREHKNVSTESNKIKADLLQCNKKVKSLNADIRRIEDQLEELRAERNEDNLNNITQELKEVRDNIASVIPQIEDQKADLAKAQEDEKSSKAAKKKATEEVTACKGRIFQLEEKMREALESKKQAKRNLDAAEKAVRDSDAAVANAEEKLVPQAKLLEERTNRAADATAIIVGEDYDGQPIQLNSSDTKENLKRKAEKLTESLKKRKEEIGLSNKTKEQVEVRLNDAKDDLNRSVAEIDRMDQEIGELKEDAKLRTKRLKKLRTQSSKTIKCVFNQYLANKKCKGTVKFDHDERRLTVEIQTDNNDANTRATDVRQLSGGERSYTTLCLLLALGHVIECPFRLMDEYDVFLDQMSRRITLAQIQQYALMKSQNGRQFLIITPQTLDDVKTNNDVRVHRVKPPIRGGAHELQQSTLAFEN